MERQQQQQDSRAESPAEDGSDNGSSDDDCADERSLQQQRQQQQQQLTMPLTADFHASALRLLVDCISHVQDSIQAAGVAALCAHATAFQQQQQQRQGLLQVVEQCCRRLSDREVAAAARKGAAAALGVLPAGLLGSTAEDVLGVLVAAVQVWAKKTSSNFFPWPIAVTGLRFVCLKIGLHASN
jgi:hypothetical protein